jgi:hypothetical protein
VFIVAAGSVALLGGLTTDAVRYATLIAGAMFVFSATYAPRPLDETENRDSDLESPH